MVQDFKRLEVWKKSVDLTAEIYRITKEFPKSEIYGLTSQIRRAAVSVSANIAEGSGKSSQADFARYLSNSLGSCKEVECHLIISQKLGYLYGSWQIVDSRVQEIEKMLCGLIKSVRK